MDLPKKVDLTSLVELSAARIIRHGHLRGYPSGYPNGLGARISVWMSVPSDHLRGYPCRYPCRNVRATDSSTRVVLS